MPTLTDYLESTIGGSAAVAVVKSTWVQLTNNSTAVAYVSTTATDSAGKFTINNLPAGSYSVATGPSATGPWTATGDTNYLVAPTAADNTSTFPGAVTVPSLTDTGLTAAQIPFADTGGLLATDATLTFNKTTKVAGANALSVSGLTGAVAGGRFVGFTAYGSPTTGTFSVGDSVISKASGSTFVCTVAGTPGTWVISGSTYNVFDYGAKGDGVTDDTAAINAALTAVPASGGTVAVPYGTYRLTANLTPKSGTVLQGSGPSGSSLSFVDDGTGPSRTIYLNSVTDVVVRDLLITQTGVTGRTGVYGNIRINASSRVSILNNRITAGSSTGIHTINATDILIQGNRISGTYADGVHISRQSTRVRIVGNDITDTGDDAIAIVSYTDNPAVWSACADILISGNTIYNLSTTRPGHGVSNGIDCAGGQNVTIVNNVIDGVLASGVAVTSGPLGAISSSTTRFPLFVSIAGNTITNFALTSAAGGILANVCRAVEITGNTIDTGTATAGSVGIRVGGAGTGVAKEVTLANNYISRPASRGIEIVQNTSTDARLITELFTNLGDAGVTTAGLTEVVVNGNTIRKVVGSSLYVNGSGTPTTVGVVVSANDVEVQANSVNDGIHVEFANLVTITGNRLTTFGSPVSSGSPILASNLTDAIISGNVSNNAGTSGINATSCTNSQISSNTLNGHSIGIYETACTNLHIIANQLQGNGTSINTNSASTIIRANRGYNPAAGVVTPAFPATTIAATNTTKVDVVAYITNGAGALTVQVDAVTALMVIPASATGTVRIPAGSTFTPTYAAGVPTWKWYGE